MSTDYTKLIVDPASVGMRQDALDATMRRIQKDIDDGLCNGVVLLAARKGKVCHLEAIGETDPVVHRKAKVDDIFLEMSATKCMTAVGILRLLD